MNREIKFRVWDNKGTMLDWLTIKQTAFNRYDTENDKPDYGLMYRSFTNPNWQLMQYTGVKDKNGVEIYEGDIIYLEYYDGLPSTKGIELKKYLRVEYFSSHTHFSAIDKYGKSYSVGFSGSAVKEWKVVGNIYEHPHLLK